MKIVLLAHYFPPINSTGAKRAEANSRYFSELGHDVTVITTKKSSRDGEFSEPFPSGIKVVELNWLGREQRSQVSDNNFEPLFTNRPSFVRKMKNATMKVCGQLPDPRLPFALSLLSPFLPETVKTTIKSADVVIGTSPPWPMLLGAAICKFRFGQKCVLDYRDQFSNCHEMPRTKLAGILEEIIDKALSKYADQIVVISDPMKSYYSRFAQNVETVYNGYDRGALQQAKKNSSIKQPREIGFVRHMGLVSPGRVPRVFFKALSELVQKNPSLIDHFRVEFYGYADLIEVYLKDYDTGIKKMISIHPNVPYHRSLELMVEADYLLFCETRDSSTASAQGILTTKLFEYIGSNRPIIAETSDQTLAGKTIKEANNIHVVTDDYLTMLRALENLLFKGRMPDVENSNGDKFSRQEQAKNYLAVLGRVS